MITRRNFIKTGMSLTAFSLIPMGFTSCGISSGEKKIGLQLYSARDNLKEDIDGTFRKLVEFGYKRFEAFGYKDGKFFEKSPKEMKSFLADLGAQMTSSHTGMRLLNEEDNTAQWESWKKNCSDAAEVGCKWIVQASYPTRQIQTIDDVKRLADQFNKCGEISRSCGLKFAFHNHHDEFHAIEGQIPYDVMIENTDKNLVFYQIDTGHLLLGGYQCSDYIKKYPGRFPIWHLRDVDSEGKGTEFGKGLVDFESLFAVADMAVLEDYFVEQGQYNIMPLDALKHNYDFLAKASYIKW